MTWSHLTCLGISYVQDRQRGIANPDRKLSAFISEGLDRECEYVPTRVRCGADLLDFLPYIVRPDSDVISSYPPSVIGRPVAHANRTSYLSPLVCAQISAIVSHMANFLATKARHLNNGIGGGGSMLEHSVSSRSEMIHLWVETLIFLASTLRQPIGAAGCVDRIVASTDQD